MSIKRKPVNYKISEQTTAIQSSLIAKQDALNVAGAGPSRLKSSLSTQGFSRRLDDERSYSKSNATEFYTNSIAASEAGSDKSEIGSKSYLKRSNTLLELRRLGRDRLAQTGSVEASARDEEMAIRMQTMTSELESIRERNQLLEDTLKSLNIGSSTSGPVKNQPDVIDELDEMTKFKEKMAKIKVS